MSFILPSIGSGIIAKSNFENAHSISLDGVNDYIDCGGNTDFSFTDGVGNDDPFSVSTWVKLDSTFKQRIISKGNVEWILTTDSSDKLVFTLYANGTTTAYRGLISDSVELTVGVWHHIVITYDGANSASGLTMYVDGAAVTASTSSAGSYTGMSSGQGALRIGLWDFNSQVMSGLVDEVSIFNYELTSSQVSTIYNSGLPNSLYSLNPLGWWRMGDNDGGTGTTITDQGSGGNDGTLTNGPTFSTDVPAFNTYSVDFDGSNDYMSISDADIFSLGNGSGTDNAFSISGWIYPPTGDGSQTFYVATKDASGSREWAFRTVVGELHFFAFGTGGGYIGRKDSTVLSNAQWYHVAMTYDGSKASSGIKLYVDGTRVDDADYASGTYTAAKNTSAEVRVSALQVNNTYSDGLIDELSIFNTELSASDITAIYNSGVPADISSLSPVGWWRMGDNDSGTGTTITDQGSGGNDGTLTNGPTFSTTVPS